MQSNTLGTPPKKNSKILIPQPNAIARSARLRKVKKKIKKKSFLKAACPYTPMLIMCTSSSTSNVYVHFHSVNMKQLIGILFLKWNSCFVNNKACIKKQYSIVCELEFERVCFHSKTELKLGFRKRWVCVYYSFTSIPYTFTHANQVRRVARCNSTCNGR